jgi:deoxyribonuclease V
MERRLLDEAHVFQCHLARAVCAQDRHGPIETVAGVDVGVMGEQGWAALVVLSWPELAVLDQAVATDRLRWPYVPGFLSFREAPLVFAAYAALRIRPDLLLCDGQGRAHPRRCGIACHLGVALDLPAIGVGKSLLCGHHDAVPNERGGCVALVHRGEQIGAVLRTRTGVAPVVVSPGHRLALESCIGWVLGTARRFRLPEPIRAAHRLASSHPVMKNRAAHHSWPSSQGTERCTDQSGGP